MSNKKLDAPDPLAAFARIFMDEAIRQVEAELEAEEKAGGAPVERKTAGKMTKAKSSRPART